MLLIQPKTMSNEIRNQIKMTKSYPPETNIAPPMDGWNTSFLLELPIFRCHVSFREGTWFLNDSLKLFSSRVFLKKKTTYPNLEVINCS